MVFSEFQSARVLFLNAFRLGGDCWGGRAVGWAATLESNTMEQGSVQLLAEQPQVLAAWVDPTTYGGIEFSFVHVGAALGNRLLAI